MNSQPQVVQVPLVRQVDESYPVVIGYDLGAQIAQRLAEPDVAALRVAIITDATVRDLMAATVTAAIREMGRDVEVFDFPAGEVSKTRATKAELEDAMIAAGFGRDTIVVAVGGGVVTDLGGFVAGTFARGVPVIQVPTTLLAAADASIGGKTGVDTPAATNLVGVFHQPTAVYIDLACWQSLPDSQIRTGLAETIKHACIADADFFARLEDHLVTQAIPLKNVLADQDFCMDIAVRNSQIKRDFVAADVHEHGRRAMLNLGHTFGRALEAVMNFQMSHGEAVAIGLAMQARWGVILGYQSIADCNRLVRLLQSAGLPTELPRQVTTDQLLGKLALDKKVRQGTVRFVFSHGIGDCQQLDDGGYTRAASEREIRDIVPTIRA